MDIQKTTKRLLNNLKDNRNGYWPTRSWATLGRRECDDSEQLVLDAVAVLFFGTTSGERRVTQPTVRRDHQCGRAEWLRSKSTEKRAVWNQRRKTRVCTASSSHQPHKPEKVRRVCNAAAKYKWDSLNDKQLTGPELLQSLVGINFRFREHQIALTADIEAMFLQVKVPQQECRVLRFLWRSRLEDKVGVYD